MIEQVIKFFKWTLTYSLNFITTEESNKTILTISETNYQKPFHEHELRVLTI